jgi:high-affinity K+ transport system ATPase subunit B
MTAMSNKKFVVEMERGDVLPLDNAAGVRVASLDGSLWLTEERGSRDVIIEAGESYEVATDGRTLLQAMSRVRIAVEAGAAQLGFTAVTQVRLAA